MRLTDSQRQFIYNPTFKNIAPRQVGLGILPSGPLWSCPSRALRMSLGAVELEDRASLERADLISGLKRLCLDADRQELRLTVDHPHWNW